MTVDNENCTKLAAKFQEKFGTFPIVIFDEHRECEDRGNHQRTYVADTGRLHLLNDFSLGYVEHLFEAALEGKPYKRTSWKYSFSDCEDWYAVLAAPPEGREIIEIEIEIL
jgi:hypothetical protein